LAERAGSEEIVVERFLAMRQEEIDQRRRRLHQRLQDRVANACRRPDVLLRHFFREVETLEQSQMFNDAFEQTLQLAIVKVGFFEIQNSKIRTVFEELCQVLHRSAKTVVANVEFGERG